jgi:hypothetical protein
MTAPNFADWAEKITGPIHDDIMTLHHNRYIWKSLLAMLEQNPDAVFHSAVNGWLSRLYSTTQAVGIRRQAATGSGDITLANVLKQIASSPRKVTLEQFLALTPNLDAKVLTKQWEANWQSGGKNFMDSARVKADQVRLEEASAAVHHYVNKRIAHLDKVVNAPPLTYDDINGALDTLGDVFKRYYRLLTGDQLAQLTPAMGRTWTQAFEFPWATQGFMPPDERDFG